MQIDSTEQPDMVCFTQKFQYWWQSWMPVEHTDKKSNQ